VFLAYLQGIETVVGSFVNNSTVTFLAYLQGIETDVYRNDKSLPYWVSSLPTRD